MDGDEDIMVEAEIGGISLFKKAKKKDCVYCLRRELPVVLVLESCGHYFCPHCLLQQYHISTITQGLGLPIPGIKVSKPSFTQKFYREVRKCSGVINANSTRVLMNFN